MDELDEFEPSELQGALVFSEDEDEMVDPDERDDWQLLQVSRARTGLLRGMEYDGNIHEIIIYSIQS